MTPSHPASAARLAACLLTGLGLAGCAGQPVAVQSDPPGATVRVERVYSDGGRPKPIRLSDDVAPLTVSLPFDKGQTYRITAAAPQYRAASAVVTPESIRGQSSVALRLAREYADSSAVEFRPAYGDRVWALVPRTDPTQAYVLADAAGGTVAPGTVEAGANAVNVTNNRSADVDYPSLAASPTGDALLYQRVERRPLPPRTVAIPAGSKATLASVAAEAGVTVAELRKSNPTLPPKLPEDAPRLSGRSLRVDAAELASEIYRQPLPNGPPSRLTRDQAAAEATPAFTAFGDEAIFASDANSPNATLWRTSLQRGSRLTRVTRGDALDYGPSAGGNLIAYTSVPARPPTAGGPTDAAGEPQPPSQVWTARADREELSRLADGSQGSISPDGRQVAYLARAARGVRELYVMDANGSAPEKLYGDLDADLRDPAWSPDGRYLAFASNARTEAERAAGVPRNWNLYVVPADGSAAPARATSNASFDAAPAFDRSGRAIYFRSNRGGAWNVWRIDADPAALLATAGSAGPSTAP